MVLIFFFSILGCATHDGFCSIKGYVQVYTWPLICSAQTASVWLTVLICTERYLAVCRPLENTSIRNIPRLRTFVCIICAFSVVYNVPRFFEFVPTERHLFNPNRTISVITDTDLRRNDIYRYLYNTVLVSIVVYAVPLIVITFLNIKIIREMRRCANRWHDLNRRQKRELKASVMPMCIVAVFLVCGSQSLAVFILDAIYMESYHEHEWLQVYTAIVNLLVIINSSLNFVIFYLFGSKFRVLLAQLVCCLEKTSPTITRHRWNKRLKKSEQFDSLTL